ncbi:MAG: polymorphic toxin-type HINT domain-containing protein, partial [Pirellula sp.]
MSFTYSTESGLAIGGVDFVDVSGTGSLGTGSEIVVSVYLNRDLDNEDTEHFYLRVSYTKGGATNSSKHAANIENLIAPLLSFKPQWVIEGEDKEVYGFLSYPIDYPGTLKLTSRDVTASDSDGDYAKIDTSVYVGKGTVSDPFEINALFDYVANEVDEDYTVNARFIENDSGSNNQYIVGGVYIKDVARGVTLKLKEEKLAYILGGDDDFDQVLDMYDLNGGPVRSRGDRRFVPVEIVVNWDDIENSSDYYANARIKFSFNEAKGAVEVQPGEDSTKLTRLWKKQWSSARSYSDRITSEWEYDFQSLGISNGSKVVVYLEALTTAAGLNEVLADLSVEVRFSKTGNPVEAPPPGFGTSGFGTSGLETSGFGFGTGQVCKATGNVRYRQLPDKFDASAADFVLANQLKFMYQELYSPMIDGVAASDPIKEFLEKTRHLSIQVRELNNWSWKSPIFAPDRIGDEPLYWVIVIDRSKVLAKGPTWGVAQIRNLIFASLGTQQSQVMSEFYSSGNNFATYQLEGTRVEEIKGRMKLWAEALQSSIDTAATVAYATAEIGVSFLPGGDLLVTAIDLASMESIPAPTALGNALLAVQVVGAFVPFVPNWVKKGAVNFGSDIISFVWKKNGSDLRLITPTAGQGAKGFVNAIDNSFYDIDHWCFTAETLVHSCEMSIPISSVRVGQNVKAFDFDNGTWGCCTVQSVQRTLYSGPLYTLRVGQSTVRATTGHPVFVVHGQELDSRPWPQQLSLTLEAKSLESGRWVNSNDLLVGDVMIGIDGEQHVISEITIEHVIDEPVYNLTIHGNHTFAVGENGLLVHNESWCE